MNDIATLIPTLLAAQQETEAHRTAAQAAYRATEEAEQRALQLGAQLLELRGSDKPFIYDGQLFTFTGSRVTAVAVDSVTVVGGTQE